MATWFLTKLTGVERIEVMAAWPHIWGAGTQLAWGAGYRESSQESSFHLRAGNTRFLDKP